MMDIEDFAADAALFARMRSAWEEVDPVPADLVDRMVAAVAVEDLSREYALLTLVETSELAAVRGESDTATLQFSDGTTSVLLHVSATEGGSPSRRRVGGCRTPSRSGSSRATGTGRPMPASTDASPSTPSRPESAGSGSSYAAPMATSTSSRPRSSKCDETIGCRSPAGRGIRPCDEEKT